LDISLIFKREVLNQLKEWKDTYKGKYAALHEGARRVGTSTIRKIRIQKLYQNLLHHTYSARKILEMMDR